MKSQKSRKHKVQPPPTGMDSFGAAREYVQKDQAVTLNTIPDGIYGVAFATGLDWNRMLAQFERDSAYGKFDDLLNFDSRKNGPSREYARYRLTLHKVASGNARTQTITEEDFNRF